MEVLLVSMENEKESNIRDFEPTREDKVDIISFKAECYYIQRIIQLFI